MGQFSVSRLFCSRILEYLPVIRNQIPLNPSVAFANVQVILAASASPASVITSRARFDATVRYLMRISRAPANDSSRHPAPARSSNGPDLPLVADPHHDVTLLMSALPAHNSG